jgi:hypothetical protein
MMKLHEKNEEEESETQKNFLMMSNDSEDLIWAFAPWQAKDFALNASAWHLDATYKLLSCAKGLFAIVVRGLAGKGLPVCYFILGKEDSSSIEKVLRGFCS